MASQRPKSTGSETHSPFGRGKPSHRGQDEVATLIMPMSDALTTMTSQ